MSFSKIDVWKFSLEIKNPKILHSFCLTEFCSKDFFLFRIQASSFSSSISWKPFFKILGPLFLFSKGDFSLGEILLFFQGANIKKFSLQLWGPWKQKRIHSSRDYWEKNDAFKIKTWDKLQRKTVLTEEIWGLGSNFRVRVRQN